MGKELFVIEIDTEDAADVARILESKAFTAGLKCPNKGCVNFLDELYYIVNPQHGKKLVQPCGLGTCASPLYTCNTCPFANRRPFSENLKFKAITHYNKEMEMKIWYERFLGIRE